MILVLDPALFLSERPGQSMTEAEEQELSQALDEVVQLCRERRPQIPEHPDYWPALQREIVVPVLKALRGGAAPRIRAAWDSIRTFSRPFPRPSIPPGSQQIRMWGVRALFGWRLAPSWLDAMIRLFVECALTGEDTYLLVRLFEGRNLQRHEANGCELHEKLRWRLQLHVPGQPPFKIPCVRSRRNLHLPWTTRLDERLPAVEDGGSCPFCPPARWFRRDVQVFGTRCSRPTWVDARGNAWARPRTGGGHHWDVYLSPPLAEEFGLDQINVSQYDSLRQDRGKRPGDVHHIPQEKRSRLRRDPGWTCP